MRCRGGPDAAEAVPAAGGTLKRPFRQEPPASLSDSTMRCIAPPVPRAMSSEAPVAFYEGYDCIQITGADYQYGLHLVPFEIGLHGKVLPAQAESTR